MCLVTLQHYIAALFPFVPSNEKKGDLIGEHFILRDHLINLKDVEPKDNAKTVRTKRKQFQVYE